jgi:hypothetical protein
MNILISESRLIDGGLLVPSGMLIAHVGSYCNAGAVLTWTVRHQARLVFGEFLILTYFRLLSPFLPGGS